MTPTTDKRQFGLKEQMTGLQRELEKLEVDILDAERYLQWCPIKSLNTDYEPTINRLNLLQHNKSETMTKIRRLKERMI